MMDLIFARARFTAMWLGHCPEYTTSDWEEIHLRSGGDPRSDTSREHVLETES